MDAFWGIVNVVVTAVVGGAVGFLVWGLQRKGSLQDRLGAFQHEMIVSRHFQQMATTLEETWLQLDSTLAAYQRAHDCAFNGENAGAAFREAENAYSLASTHLRRASLYLSSELVSRVQDLLNEMGRSNPLPDFYEEAELPQYEKRLFTAAQLWGESVRPSVSQGLAEVRAEIRTVLQLDVVPSTNAIRSLPAGDRALVSPRRDQSR